MFVFIAVENANIIIKQKEYREKSVFIMQSYREMSRECLSEAREMQKTIEKYKKQTRHAKNREEINAKIYKLELIYSELINKANALRELAERSERK